MEDRDFARWRRSTNASEIKGRSAADATIGSAIGFCGPFCLLSDGRRYALLLRVIGGLTEIGRTEHAAVTTLLHDHDQAVVRWSLGAGLRQF